MCFFFRSCTTIPFSFQTVAATLLMSFPEKWVSFFLRTTIITYVLVLIDFATVLILSDCERITISHSGIYFDRKHCEG